MTSSASACTRQCQQQRETGPCYRGMVVGRCAVALQRMPWLHDAISTSVRKPAIAAASWAQQRLSTCCCYQWRGLHGINGGVCIGVSVYKPLLAAPSVVLITVVHCGFQSWGRAIVSSPLQQQVMKCSCSP
jgi:hypothetical protein